MRIPGVPAYDEELHDRIEENFKVIRLCMQLTEPEFGAVIGIGKLRVQQITLGEKELSEVACKRLINACCCYDYKHQHLAEIVHFVILKPPDWMTLERSTLILCQLIEWFMLRQRQDKTNTADILAHYISELTKKKTLLAPDLTGVHITVRRADRDE